jgi:hypothetical protein
MSLSKEAKLMSGLTLLVVPTIMYGGWTLLGVVIALVTTAIGLLRATRDAR